MWQCASCEYHNDDWDDLCQRCEAARPEVDNSNADNADASAGDAGGDADATVVGKPQEPSHTAGQRSDTSKPRRLSVLELVAVVVIVLSILAIVAFGYLAWQAGLLADYGLAPPTRTADDPLTPLPQIAPSTAPGLPEDHPLVAVYNAKVQGMKRFHAHADAVLETAALVDGYRAQHAQDPEVDGTAAALDELQAIGADLWQAYSDFENDVAQFGNNSISEFLLLVRAQYIDQMDGLLRHVGDIYIADSDGTHRAYGLSDDFPMAVEPHDTAAAARLRLVWSVILNQHTQYLLDIETAEEQQQVEARISALYEVRQSFEDAMESIPPYNLRAGRLDKAARDTLDLLDTYADNIEALVLEFNEYYDTNPGPVRCDNLAALISRCEGLGQQLHEYTFDATYRIYAVDKELKHPAYARLTDRYAFAKEQWPERDMVYRRIYGKYESEWDARWRD